MDTMSGLDAAFLHLEEQNKPMHIGGVSIFEGPPPAFERVREMVTGKLGLVPRYRQKAWFVPLGIGGPTSRRFARSSAAPSTTSSWRS